MGPLAVAVADRAQAARAPSSAGRGLAHRNRRRCPSRPARDAPGSRLLDGGGADAGDRHRRLHGGLQHHQRAALGIAALPESRTAGDGVGERQGQSRANASSSRIPTTKTGNGKRRASRRWASGSTGPSTWRRRPSPNRCRAFAPPRACSRCWACRRRWAASSREAEEAPGHRLVVISDGVWRTHLGGRASAIGSLVAPQRRAVRGDRRHAEGIPVPLAQQRRVGAVCDGGAGSPARFAFVLGRGANQAGRDVRIGARRDRADRPRAPAALRGERGRGRHDHARWPTRDSAR